MTTQRARKRQVSGQMQAVQARYDAAGTGRRIAKWNPPASGPLRSTEAVDRLIRRARDTARNDWAAEAGTSRWVTNLVGLGVQPRWKDQKIRDLWDRFAPEADADGVLDVYGQQALGTRSWLEGGEVFIRNRPRDLSLPLAVPTQFQLIESEFCPRSFTADVWPGLPAGNTITQGIERNRFGRRTAYWFFKEHPHDGKPGANDLVRVLAQDVGHMFEVKRPGQLRGVSDLAPILVKLRAVMDFEDAVLDRQKLANLFTVFFTRQLPQDWSSLDTDAATGMPVFWGKQGEAIASLEPGMGQTLLPGEDVKFANPPEAGTTYSDYMRTSHLGTAAGRGLPYELMTGDIRDVSDRTLRLVVQEFRRFATQRQWHVLIHQFVRLQVRWFVQAAVLAGKISVRAADAAMWPEFSTHAWEYIHPVQDAQGKQTLLEMGVISKSSIISGLGDDPAKTFQQRADDQKTEDSLGLTPPPAAAPAGGPNAAQGLTFEAFRDETEARLSALEENS